MTPKLQTEETTSKAGLDANHFGGKFGQSMAFHGLRSDDVVVVTGGFGGLGREICRQFVKRGVAKVYSLDVQVPMSASGDCSHDNNSDTNTSTPSTSDSESSSITSKMKNKNKKNNNNIGARDTCSQLLLPSAVKGVEYIKCDVSDINQVRKAAHFISQQLQVLETKENPEVIGNNENIIKSDDNNSFLQKRSPVRKRVTVLVNNAGIMRGKPLLQLSNDDIQLSINVNLLGSFNTLKTFLPGMVEGKRGFIVTIASVLGHLSPAQLSTIAKKKKKKKRLIYKSRILFCWISLIQKQTFL